MNDGVLFRQLVREAKADPSIIGFFLSGSRGKGRETAHSDYDIEVVVKDGTAQRYKNKYRAKRLEGFGFTIFSLSEFREHAALCGPLEWDRPSYAHVKAIIDKTGEIQRLIDAKGRIPKGVVKRYVSGHLDGYINYVYRSLKCFRDGNPVGARLEAALSLPCFLHVLFGMEGRTTPYAKYLEWELKAHPLRKCRLKPKEITTALLRILKDADVRTQQRLFKALEMECRKGGYGRVFESWDPDSIAFIKSFRALSARP